MGEQSGKSRDVFPLRYLGFGFFWSWLYAVELTPSPLFGTTLCLGNTPFELTELAIRCVILIGCIIAAKYLVHSTGRRICFIVAIGSSVAAAACMTIASSPAVCTVAATFVAVAEVVIFLLWLSFFGSMRTGDVFILLVASQASGAALLLIALFLGQTALQVIAFAFPTFSLVALKLSYNLEPSGANEAPIENNRANISSEPAEEHSGESSLIPTEARSLGRTIGALALYSLTFALAESALFSSAAGGTLPGYLTETIDALLLAAAVAAFFAARKDPASVPYEFYRLVPLFLGAGIALLALLPNNAGIASCIAGLGFVAFQVLALNDSCNVVQRTEETLFRTMAIVRLAISAGLGIGRMAGLALVSALAISPAALTGISMVVVIAACSIVFTDSSRTHLQQIANDREIEEDPLSRTSKEQAIRAFIEAKGLSKRESEVFEFLLAGRTTVYAAEKLFIAESTIRAHVYSIYRKTGIHSRMELLDSFERFWEDLDERPGCDEQSKSI